MLSPVRQRLVSRCLVQLPAIWGKLPNQADYIRHRCSVVEAQAWQRWASEFWLRPTMAARTRPAARPRQHWVELNAPVTKPDLELVPVSFLLLPGMLDFAPDHFVQGVCVTSHDSVGRQCPLIIFQTSYSGCLISCPDLEAATQKTVFCSGSRVSLRAFMLQICRPRLWRNWSIKYGRNLSQDGCSSLGVVQQRFNPTHCC